MVRNVISWFFQLLFGLNFVELFLGKMQYDSWGCAVQYLDIVPEIGRIFLRQLTAVDSRFVYACLPNVSQDFFFEKFQIQGNTAPHHLES